eukprot:13681312-Alexandrium_andersonii.AAC.1
MRYMGVLLSLEFGPRRRRFRAYGVARLGPRPPAAGRWALGICIGSDIVINRAFWWRGGYAPRSFGAWEE